MTKPTGIGRGKRPGSLKALRERHKRSPLQKVTLTLRFLPEKAKTLLALKNRSGAIASFLETHWEELETFLKDWEG